MTSEEIKIKQIIVNMMLSKVEPCLLLNNFLFLWVYGSDQNVHFTGVDRLTARLHKRLLQFMFSPKLSSECASQSHQTAGLVWCCWTVNKQRTHAPPPRLLISWFYLLSHSALSPHTLHANLHKSQAEPTNMQLWSWIWGPQRRDGQTRASHAHRVVNKLWAANIHIYYIYIYIIRNNALHGLNSSTKGMTFFISILSNNLR